MADSPFPKIATTYAGAPQTCAFEGARVPGPACGEPAAHHVVWGLGDAGASGVCLRHRDEVRAFAYYALHDIGADCEMPGALYFPDENCCRVPWDEGAPTISVQREVPVG